MWIIPNNHPLYSAYAPAFLASREDLKELSEVLPSQLMWRSKPSSLPTWYQRWNRVYWLRLLFGRTLKPSMQTSFAERLTASLADIPASPLVLSEHSREKTTTTTYGPTSPALSCEQGSLFSCSLKTSSTTCVSVIKQSNETLNNLVIRCRKEYTLRLKLALHTAGKDFLSSLWTTPSARDWKDSAGMSKTRGGGATQNRSAREADIFPRGRGIQQWNWEEPRLIETQPRMGSPVDGYNFREDLLRAYGNSVVSQTAEIAFIDLLKKHIKNGK
jgi:hypothetical protein